MQSEVIDVFKIEIGKKIIASEIATIYLYGSLVNGKLRKDSDIDIAILPSFDTSNSHRLELISKTEALFSEILKKLKIHLDISIVDLRAKYISLSLQYAIITKGVVLYTNNFQEQIEFENFVKGEYFDFVPYLISLRRKKGGDIFKKVRSH